MRRLIPRIRSVTLPIYLMTMSLILFIALGGYVLSSNRAHARANAEANAQRQRQVNAFLRSEVCERLELRDEIQLSYLTYVRDTTTDAAFRRVLSDAILALEYTQLGCANVIPEMKEGGS